MKSYRRQSPFLIYLFASLGVLGLLLFGLSLVRQVNDTARLWDQYHVRVVERDEALHQMVRHFGYGGFIHDFKNYVLRQDETLIPMLEEDLASTRQAIAEYRRRSTDEPSLQAIKMFEAVVDQYADKLALVQRLVEEGLPPRQIDAQVKVDDSPALHAIEQLQARIGQQAAATRQAVDDSLRQVMDQIKLSALLFLPIFLVTALLVRERQNLARAHEETSAARRYLSELIEAIPDALLIVEASGTIIQVNIQAERLLGYPRERLVGMQVEALLPERMRDGHVAMRLQGFEKSAVRPMESMREFLVLDANGREIPVSISLSFSQQDSGRIALVSLRDISEQKATEAALQKEHAALQMAQSLTHLGSWDWDLLTGKHAWSDEMYRLLGLRPEDDHASSRLFLRHVHPADRHRLVQAIRQVIRDGDSHEIDYRIVRADGYERFMHGLARAVRDDQGRVVRLIGTLHDVTERKQYERELRLDKAIIDQISQPILVTDQDSRIVDMNDAFCEMTGYNGDELLGKTPALLKSGLHDPDYYRRMWDSLKLKGRWQSEVWLRTKDGEVMPRLMSITRVCDDDETTCRYVGLYADITALKENEARLETLAHFDALTGLANRILFHDRLRAGMARARRSGKLLALLFLDLDGFKAVNDRYGHQRGDELLVEVATRLSSSLREDDTVARLGGDEFAIILNEVDDRAEVEELAERLLQQVTILVGAGEAQVQVTGSLGIAIYPDDGEDQEALLRAADQAMYRAKQAGRNRYIFSDGA